MTKKSRAPELRAPAGTSGTAAVFLVGFMGSGKSTVGEVLSRQLGWHFVDLDSRIESHQGCTIPEIFRNLGEAGFRQAERAALLDLLMETKSTPTVAALGGGAFVQPDNLRDLESSGIPAVFLDIPVEELWQRCLSQPSHRPLGQDLNQFRQLYEARRPIYMKAALRIDARGKDADAIAREIALRLGLDHAAKEK